jgi:hypothetical protein
MWNRMLQSRSIELGLLEDDIKMARWIDVGELHPQLDWFGSAEKFLGLSQQNEVHAHDKVTVLLFISIL